MDRVCRVCMSSETLVDIFAERQLPEIDVSLVDMLNECIEFQVKREDKLPKKICESCNSDVKAAFRLKRNSVQSHKILSVKLKDIEIEDIIDMLDAEDWELIKDPVKQEVEEDSEVVQVNLNTTKKKTNYNKAETQKAGSKNLRSNTTHERLNIMKSKTNPKKQETQKSNRKNLKSNSKSSFEKRFSCKTCGKVFARNSNLILHSRIHTGERPYKCPKCEKSFSQSSNLHRHRRVHTGERPYMCPKCQKCFTQSTDLNKHLQRHTVELQFKCPHCPKEFTRKHNFVRHLKKRCYTQLNKTGPKIDDKRTKRIKR